MLLLCLKQYKDTLFNSTKVSTMVFETLYDLHITLLPYAGLTLLVANFWFKCGVLISQAFILTINSAWNVFSDIHNSYHFFMLAQLPDS